MVNHIFRKYFPTETKPPLNQINTIRMIARNRKQSKTTLAKELKKSYPNISEAVKQLELKGLVKQTTPPIGHTTKRGNIEKFYKLTNEGLKVAIKDPLEKKEKSIKPLTSEQFRDSFFETLDDASNQKEVADVSSLYLREILGVEPRYLLPKFFFDWHSQYGWDTKPEEWINSLKEIIITIIANGKPRTLEQLDFAFKTSGEYKKIINFTIDFLYFRGLLKKSEFGKKGKYDLTHLGVIQLLFYLYRDASIPLHNKSIIGKEGFYGVEKSKDPDAKKFVKTFNKIRIKYANLFPKIFNGENYQKLRIGSYEICVLLMHLYKNEPYWRIVDTLDRDDEWSEEYQVMQRFERTRQEFYYRKWSEHLEKTEFKQDEFDEIKFKKNPRASPIIDWFNQSLVLKGSEDWREFDQNTSEKVFYYNRYASIIENRITFDFFSIYKAYCNGWDTGGMGKSKIKKWHDKESKVLLDFIKNYIKEKEKMFEVVA